MVEGLAGLLAELCDANGVRFNVTPDARVVIPEVVVMFRSAQNCRLGCLRVQLDPEGVNDFEHRLKVGASVAG